MIRTTPTLQNNKASLQGGAEGQKPEQSESLGQLALDSHQLTDSGSWSQTASTPENTPEGGETHTARQRSKALASRSAPVTNQLLRARQSSASEGKRKPENSFLFVTREAAD